MDAYKLAVSEVAEKIPFNLLTNEFKSKLFTENTFDPETHEIYRIPVGIIYISVSSNRKRKRFSIQRTDRIFVEIRMPDVRIHLAGIYPTSLKSGQTIIDYEREAIFELNPKIMKFQIGGKIKGQKVKEEVEILASRVPPIAQWIYFKPFILSGKKFDNHIICSIPKEMIADRYLICNVESKIRNRTIAQVKDKRVALQ